LYYSINRLCIKLYNNKWYVFLFFFLFTFCYLFLRRISYKSDRHKKNTNKYKCTNTNKSSVSPLRVNFIIHVSIHHNPTTFSLLASWERIGQHLLPHQKEGTAFWPQKLMQWRVVKNWPTIITAAAKCIHTTWMNNGRSETWPRNTSLMQHGW